MQCFMPSMWQASCAIVDWDLRTHAFSDALSSTASRACVLYNKNIKTLLAYFFPAQIIFALVMVLVVICVKNEHVPKFNVDIMIIVLKMKSVLMMIKCAIKLNVKVMPCAKKKLSPVKSIPKTVPQVNANVLTTNVKSLNVEQINIVTLLLVTFVTP